MNFDGHNLSATYLYRLFSGKELLYIGIAENVPSRMKQHEATKKDWWHAVNCITFTEHPSRRDAEIRERLAIRCELPVYNVQHRPSDAEVLEVLLGVDGELSDYIDGGQPAIEKHFKNQVGETYCRTVHLRGIEQDIQRFVDRNQEWPAFRAKRAYELLLREALVYATDPCDAGCPCRRPLQLVLDEAERPF